MPKCILTEQGGKGNGGGGATITLRKLEVTTPPTTTAYLAGDTFNAAGMVVTASYGMGNAIISTAEATGYKVEPTTLVDGVTEVTISYTEFGETCATKQAVTVKPKLQSISATAPTTEYEYQGTFPSTYSVTAKYSDGSSKTVTANCSNCSLSAVGSHTINLSYTDNTIRATTATTTLTIDVKRKKVNKPSLKTTYNSYVGAYTGNAYNINSATYLDNYNATYYTVSGNSSTNAGSYTMTCTPTANYRWSDGTTTGISIAWAIDKASRTASVSPSALEINATTLTKTASATTTAGGGNWSMSPTSITGLNTFSINASTGAITATGNGSTAISSTTVTVTRAADSNYKAASATFTIKAEYWTFGAGNGETADAAWLNGLKAYLASGKTGASLKTTSGASIVGATKTITLTTSILGTTSHLIRVIGVDQDGDNTVTWQTANCLAQTTVFGSNSAQWTSSGCTAKTQCLNYYKALPGYNSSTAKVPYIKEVSKGTCPSTNDNRNATPTYNTETVWLPSEREMGLDSCSPLSTANSTTSKAECTQGYNAAYTYYNSNDRRIKKLGDSGSAQIYWERSRSYISSYSTFVCRVYSSGNADWNIYSRSSGLAPAFVIG